MWRKAMLYLGLGDDVEDDAYYADYDEPERNASRDRPHQAGRPVGPAASAAPVSAYPDEPSAIGAVRPIGGRGADPRDTVQVTGQTITPSGMNSGMNTPRPRPQVVRPIPVVPNAKPHVVVPTSFNQAQEVADKLKGNQPVIMNLQGDDKDLARRLIDFASGLCYGIGGQMERVANQVYLLTPSNVEVSQEERRRLHERGYDS